MNRPLFLIFLLSTALLFIACGEDDSGGGDGSFYPAGECTLQQICQRQTLCNESNTMPIDECVNYEISFCDQRVGDLEAYATCACDCLGESCDGFGSCLSFCQTKCHHRPFVIPPSEP